MELILSFVIVGVGLIAGSVPFFVSWTHTTAHRWIGFGAGVILGAAFLHMIPEAMEMTGPSSAPAILIGFLALYVVEQTTLKHPHDEERGKFHELGLITFVGFILHDLVDGLALGSGQQIPSLTPAVFAALLLHKIPTMFSLSLLMVHGGFRRIRIVGFLCMVLFAIPLGVLLSDTIVRIMPASPPEAIAWLILFSAGTFLYIGAYELLPEMTRKSEPEAKIWLFFLSGVALMALLKLIHPVV